MAARFPSVELDTDQLPGGPWIYARQVREPANGIENGALVEVLDRSGRFVGHGLYNAASDIRVRMLARERRNTLDRPRDFLLDRLRAADRLRRKVLRLPEVTDAWRVVHAEGDDLSGLVVDKLADVLVAEYHALGFWKLRREVETALLELFPGHRVVHRVPASASRAERFEPEEPALDVGEILIHEHGLAFHVRPGRDHKTGWFCDQRDNRARAALLARDFDVQDLCCNAGGFALHAARAGARHVRGVDLDEKVLDRAQRSAAANALQVDFVHADVFDHLRALASSTRKPRLAILDPHKLATGRKDLEEGLRRYLDMNALAMAALAPGGLLFTFSCSGAVELPVFLGTLFQAGRRAGRALRLLETVGAAPDHPQRPEFPRSRYLKGALLHVE
jgi:23S rRNA (cytosine1962-C5)-methyltransferase